MSIETDNAPSPQSELDIEELTVPENWEDLGLWMESLIGFQLEEAEKRNSTTNYERSNSEGIARIVEKRDLG